ncbi:SCO2522 family protein [Nocardia sp. NPDC050697]|uniref:SCO2522 family protein n=1 Tax=Nocardia sp. NPDC050697 TaxID=3155158 RepID=UPI0033FCB810
MAVRSAYDEATEHAPVAHVPLSHLSIEVGHFRLKEITDDPALVRAEFRRIVPLISAFVESTRLRHGDGARISTCYLLDDYFQPETDPSEILPELLTAASEAGLVIDYLGRESACWRAAPFANGAACGEPLPVAEMVAARIVSEPAPPDNGSRPPTAQSGWLCNGRRSSEYEPSQAMRTRTYRPPEEFGRRSHSIFLDVELWSQGLGQGRPERQWSCQFLASVWHLFRLGMLRHHGAVVAEPHLWQGRPWPDNWQDLPPVMQLNPTAAPFAAFKTLSMLPKQYLPIEHAVRVILDHLDLDDDITHDVVARGASEDNPIMVSRNINERVSHLLLDGS